MAEAQPGHYNHRIDSVYREQDSQHSEACKLPAHMELSIQLSHRLCEHIVLPCIISEL